MSETHYPTTEQLLLFGGDARVALDPVSGLNKYGCRPYPDEGLLAFGSSTASVVSQAGFLAANTLRERLIEDASAYPREMQRIRSELLEDVSDLGAALVFASSGTDAHLIAKRCVAKKQQRPLAVVMVEEAETGSGVFEALSGCGPEHRVEVVSLRLPNGTPRPSALIDQEVSRRVHDALEQGWRVLLVAIDQSKTGLIAPSVDCVLQLHGSHREHLDVLIDACQFRIAPATLRAYLQQGFMVALTGSKFYTGPSFSAALLLPTGFSSEGDTPCDQIVEGEFARMGLALRWEAALAEFRRFRRLSEDGIIHVMQTFGAAVRQRLANDPHFEALGVPQLDRRPLIAANSWDHLPSIFSFMLYKPAGRIPLTREEIRLIYTQLQVSQGGEALRCQFGQAVSCGMQGGVAVSVLRLCLSARLISDALTQNGVNALIEDALAALDKTARLVDKLG